MGRRIKLKDDTYLDDSSIHHNGEILKEVLEELIADNEINYKHLGTVSTLDHYNSGIYRYAKGGSDGPGGCGYGILIVFPYRKASGNTKQDFAAQLFIPNGDSSTGYKDNIFIRTSTASAWRAWTPLINNYITDKEMLTNETLDGKPVYAKRITITSDITASSPLSKAHNISDVDEIWVDTSHSYMRSNNSTSNLSYPLPATEYYGNFDDKTGISVDRTTIRVYAQSGWGSGWTKTFMLKYTKTTD